MIDLNVIANHKQRLDGIDVLRGLSILAVVLLHISLRMQIAGFNVRTIAPPWLFHLLFRNGNNGVTVFFAVSGFLITFTSIRRFGSLGSMRPGAFYRIRFARIAPPLLLILAILSALHLLHATGFYIAPAKASLARALLAALTFHLNWLEAVRGWLPANWDVLWSLSVEEAFYAVFPLFCLLTLGFARKTTLFCVVLTGFIALGPFARTIWAFNEIWAEKSYLGGMDGIAMGCLSALLADRLLRSGRRPATLLTAIQIAGAAMIFLIALWPASNWMSFIGRSGLDGTVLALGACCVIVASVLRGKQGGRFTAALRWFGRHSYEVYLTHEFPIVWGTLLYAKIHRGPLWGWFIAMAAVSAPLGAVFSRYFSEPMNRRLRAGVTAESGREKFVAAGND